MNRMITPHEFKIPDNWLCNTHTEHNKEIWRYNSRGRAERVEIDCRCKDCIKKDISDVITGAPVQVHEEYPSTVLTEMGYIGLYKISIK